MKSLLILRKLSVENANTIAGITYGFPAVSAFLGFTHALSRELDTRLGVKLGGCAVVCHQHQVHAYQPAGWGDYVFSLTRNPLTKEGNTPAFVEEGRMHMEVSLLIECDFISDDFDFDTGDQLAEIRQFQELVQQQALSRRLAGGVITNLESVEFIELDDAENERAKQIRQQLYRSLPGFALVDRSGLLQDYRQQMAEQGTDLEIIDAWLDFFTLKQKAVAKLQEDEEPTEQSSADWQLIEKPASGWLVPIVVGYRGISPLYEGGEVARTRDGRTPFRFVEPAYGVGQWISPHRIRNIEHLIWRYQLKDDWYLCKNLYQAPAPLGSVSTMEIKD